jgi:hypothetical protein
MISNRFGFIFKTLYLFGSYRSNFFSRESFWISEQYRNVSSLVFDITRTQQPIGVQFMKYELGEECFYIKILILVVTHLGLGFIRLIMLGPAGSPGRARKLLGELHVVNKLDA